MFPTLKLQSFITEKINRAEPPGTLSYSDRGPVGIIKGESDIE